MKFIVMSHFRHCVKDMLTMRAFLITALLILCTSAYSVQTPNTNKPDQEAKTDTRGTKENPISINIESTKKTPDDAKQEQIDREKRNSAEKRLGDLTEDSAKSTRALVVIGYIQFVVFVLQLIAFVFQARYMRREYLSSHRPKLVVRRFQLHMRDKEHPPSVEFVVANVGRSDAKIVLDNVTIKLLQIGDMELLERESFPRFEGQVDILEKRKYRPTERQAQDIQFRLEDKDAAIIAIHEKTARLVCFGFIRYEDTLGETQETRFYRSCVPKQPFMEPSKDPDYEDS